MPGLLKKNEVRITLSPNDLIQAVASTFEVSVNDMLGPTRPARLIIPRYITMYIMRKRNLMCLKDIGNIFNRDHTSVIHAIQNVRNMLDTKDPVFLHNLAILRDKTGIEIK